MKRKLITSILLLGATTLMSLKAQTAADITAFLNKQTYGEGFVTITYSYSGITYSTTASKADKLINRIPATVTVKKNCLDKNQKYGFIDTTGKWIIQPVYDKASSFVDGLAIVLQCGPNGYKSWHITLNGQPLYSQRYTDIHNFVNGYAQVDKDGGYHMCHINKAGQPLYSQTYQWLWDFNTKGKAIGIRNINMDKNTCTWVVMNTQGKELYTKVATYDVDKIPVELNSYLK